MPWTLQLASGEMSEAEFKLAVRGKTDLVKVEALTQAVSRVIDLGFYAIDLILCKGEFHILEINPNPICHFYNSDNGRADFVWIYERLMRKYVLGERRPQRGPTGALVNQRNG